MTDTPTPADLAAFGASEAACYLYPGADQQPLRAAYCAGAASMVPACTPLNLHKTDNRGIEMTEAVEILRRAKELIETKGWIQHSYAMTPDGEPTFRATLDCSAFCVSGALIAVEGQGQTIARSFLQVAVGNTDVSFWNDHACTSKEMAIGFLDRAIALAEKSDV